MNLPTFPDNEIPLVLNYRSLKTSFLITLIWLGLAVLCLVLIRSEGTGPGTLRFQTLVAAALFCVIFSLHSLNSSGGPFISFYVDHLVVNHSLLRRITLYYNDITSINIANEEIEFLRMKLPPVVINLGMLSFEDQERCLSAVNRLFASVMEAGTPPGKAGHEHSEGKDNEMAGDLTLVHDPFPGQDQDKM